MHAHSLSIVLLAVGGLFLVSVLASKVSSRLGIPSLLFFLLIGIVAGSEGVGGIHFSNYHAAHVIGTLALVAILFSGGLDTEWKAMRPVVWPAISLATIGVVCTASLVGIFSHYLFGLSWEISLLIGAVVSSTDAAAVFSIMRSKGVRTKGNLGHLIELESGINDPLAVFLTTALTAYIITPDAQVIHFVVELFWEMFLGASCGLVIGYGAYRLINGVHLDSDGLYPVLTFGVALLAYGIPTGIGGNGFLSCYIAGLTLGSYKFVHRVSLTQFHEGIAWLMQIIMFLCLGLLVFPSRLMPLAVLSAAASIFLIIIARPIAVWLALLPFKFTGKEKLFVSWVGLRGAVPIILAIIPVTGGVKDGEQIFNLVFFVVAISVMVQGVGVGWIAKKLGLVDENSSSVKERNISTKMLEIEIPPGSKADGRMIVELNLPDEILVVLITRGEQTLVPRGGTLLRAGDVILLQDRGLEVEEVRKILIGEGIANG